MNRSLTKKNQWIDAQFYQEEKIVRLLDDVLTKKKLNYEHCYKTRIDYRLGLSTKSMDYLSN